MENWRSGSHFLLHYDVEIVLVLWCKDFDSRSGSFDSGCDGAFVGVHENRYVILKDDGMGLILNFLEVDLMMSEPSVGAGGIVKNKANAVPDAISFENPVAEIKSDGAIMTSSARKPNRTEPRRPLSFVFDSPAQRMFLSPLESTILYVWADCHLGVAKVSSEAYLTTGGHLMLSTKPEAGKFLKLKPLERVLQVSK